MLVVEVDMTGEEELEHTVLVDQFGEDLWIDLSKAVREKIHSMWLDLTAEDDPTAFEPMDRYQYFVERFVQESMKAYEARERGDMKATVQHYNAMTDLLGYIEQELD